MFSQVNCMHMTKDESTLITGDRGKSVIVWDMSSGERKSTLKADGTVRLLAMPCAVVVCGVHMVGVAWLSVLVLGVCLCARPIVRVRCGVDVAACVLACVRLWERVRCVVLCIVGSVCGSCWVACVGRRCASLIARVW